MGGRGTVWFYNGMEGTKWFNNGGKLCVISLEIQRWLTSYQPSHPKKEEEKLIPLKGEEEERGMPWWVEGKCPLPAP